MIPRPGYPAVTAHLRVPDTIPKEPPPLPPSYRAPSPGYPSLDRAFPDTSDSDAGEGLAGLSQCRREGRKLIPSSSSPVCYYLPPRLHHSDPLALLPLSTLNSISAVSSPSALPLLPLSTLNPTSAPSLDPLPYLCFLSRPSTLPPLACWTHSPASAPLCDDV
eukprot:3481520-Rhodomonas_salina.2